MRDAGVHTVIARPIRNILKTILVSRLDLRNHRKMTIIDGDITYCGSQNCADAAFQHKSRFAPWIDVLVRFTGPIATQNRQLFECDWAIQTGQDLPSPKGVCAPEGETLPAIVWGDGPMNRLGTSQQMFATLFGQARQSLTITTPYFVPGDIVLEALCACAWRGVKVTLILPARNDSWFVSAASRSHYATMLASGIEIFEYNAGLLHSKTVTIDETVGLVGSSNLDRRSFDLNYENNILFHDRVLTQAIRERQDTYILSSTSVTTAHVAAWPLRRRIWNNLIATAGPIL
jgi:cardiolipin synthase